MSKYSNFSKEELLTLVEKQESELASKKYGLVWDTEREPEQVVLDCEHHLPVLKRVKGKEIKTALDQGDNILIEGDNYHALTVLNYTHQGKIDVIYIDPPYNTEKEGFIYNDKKVDINDGYRHSKWLTFIEKRLRIAKNLLNETGVVFISINDAEVSQLKILCDTIFSESNFISKLVWENKEGGGSSDSDFFRIKHEYVLVYAKNKESLVLEGEYSTEDVSYNNEDSYVEERGRHKLIKLNSFSIQYSKSLDYEIELPNGEKIFPSEGGKRGCWRWSKNKLVWGIKNDFIEFKENQDGKLWVYTKQYFHVDENNEPIQRKVPYRGVISKWSSTLATKQLEKIFNAKKFSYPKPYELIKFLVSLHLNKKALVLDFFAGSGTTGHAVLELNKEDTGSRNFIMCTNNEVGTIKEKEFKDSYKITSTELNTWKESGKKEWVLFNEEFGICTSVTYPRMLNVITGYKFNGKEPALLYEKKITFSQLKNIEQILADINTATESVASKFDKIEKVFEDGFIKVFGIKNINGKKPGLGGNLQYFKTDLVKKTKNKDQMRMDLTQKCTDMLCVKENVFNLESDHEDYKIFSSNQKDQFLCVYYNFYDESFDDFIKEIKKLKGHKRIYMFSMDGKTDKSLFGGVNDFDLEEIPQKVIEIYKQLVKMNIPVKTETIFLDFEKANKKVFEDKEKDEGARVLRIVLEKTIQKIAQKNGVAIVNDQGKEEKISFVNDALKNAKLFSKVQWEENKTYLTIGNHASHGEYDEYDLKQVENFYKHVQELHNFFGI